MAKRAKIEGMPEDTRRWLERALIDNGFSGYRELEELLKGKGFVISKSAIQRYGQKIERRFAAIKASTEAARMLTEGAADDQDVRSEAVIALVQTELFEAIINMQEASEEDVSMEDRVGILSTAAKNIATLARASVTLKKFQADVRTKAAAAAEEVAKVVQQGGLSSEAVDNIRRQILGIAQ
jgi:hypothetical protein